MDDIIVKSSDKDHVSDLRECFETLKRHNMRINLMKCTYGVRSRKFLDYLVSEREIEAN